MYLEQEMYSADGDVYEMILVQKNRTEVGFMWNLGPGSYRVIDLSESQMQASTVILTTNPEHPQFKFLLPQMLR
jgi:hypothetical protein